MIKYEMYFNKLHRYKLFTSYFYCGSFLCFGVEFSVVGAFYVRFHIFSYVRHIAVYILAL